MEVIQKLLVPAVCMRAVVDRGRAAVSRVPICVVVGGWYRKPLAPTCDFHFPCVFRMTLPDSGAMEEEKTPGD